MVTVIILNKSKRKRKDLLRHYKANLLLSIVRHFILILPKPNVQYL